MSERYLTIAQVADELQVSTKSVRRHIEPSARVGGMNRYLMSDVRRQVASEADLPDNVTQLQPSRKGRAA